MAKTDFQNGVINRIRKLRIDNNMSQTELAYVIEVSNGQIGNIESSKFQHKYTLKHLYVLSRYFNVPINFLLTGEMKQVDAEELIQSIIKYDE